MKRQELHPRTEILNKKQKNIAKTSRNAALLWLATVFPKAFDNSVLIRPLKKGIMNDILQHTDKAAAAGISKSKLREAVVVFTRRIDYLTCLKAREMRIDLEGNPVTAVTEDEANNAALKIKKRVEKSTKNARKITTDKPTPKSNDSIKYPSEQYLPYADSAYDAAQSPRTASVLVKHKSTRAYDPDAVARMKEKLGLTRKRELEQS